MRPPPPGAPRPAWAPSSTVQAARVGVAPATRLASLPPGPPPSPFQVRPAGVVQAVSTTVPVVRGVSSYDQLKSRIADGNYYVNARDQYYEAEKPPKRTRKVEYGVSIRYIRKDKSESTLETFLHMHCTTHATSGLKILSMHFKNGPSKFAGAGFEVYNEDYGGAVTKEKALALATALLGKTLDDWTSIKGVALP